MADPRKTADLVLGLSSEGAPEGEAPASPPPLDEGLDAMAEAKRAAAGDAMAALKSGDVGAFESALSAFFEACSGGGYSGEG